MNLILLQKKLLDLLKEIMNLDLNKLKGRRKKGLILMRKFGKNGKPIEKEYIRKEK